MNYIPVSAMFLKVFFGAKYHLPNSLVECLVYEHNVPPLKSQSTVVVSVTGKTVEESQLRMYCIDSPRVSENSDAGAFHCLYD